MKNKTFLLLLLFTFLTFASFRPRRLLEIISFGDSRDYHDVRCGNNLHISYEKIHGLNI